MRHLLLAIIVAAILGASGCISPEPKYRVEDVAFDPGMLGRWVRVSPEAEEGDNRAHFLLVESRQVTVNGDRVDGDVAGAPVRTGDSTPPKMANALTITQFGKSAGSSVRSKAYLLRCNGSTFIGLQSALEELSNEKGLFVLPVHFLMLCERTDDSVTLRSPKRVIAWVPLLTPLDSPATGASDIPSAEQLEAIKGIAFTPDVDRLLRIYGAHAKDDSFWEAPTVYRRARAE